MNFQQFTRLPLKVVLRDNSVGGVVVVQTPQGEEILDLQEIHTAMFGANRTDERLPTEIIHQLRKLERKAIEFLLEQWINSSSQPV